MTAWAQLACALTCLCAPPSQSTALEEGRALKAEMRGAAPHRREAARLAAVRAFRAGLRGSGTPALRALCGLRAGELLLAADLEESGLTELMRGAELSGSSWSQRARLSAGACMIRLGRCAEGARWLAAAEWGEAPSPTREEAAVLRGVALARCADGEAATRAWREVAELGVTPRVRFDAFERWGRELLSRGDVEGAAGVLHRCREVLSVVALEETASGRDMRKRLRSSQLARSLRRSLSSR